MTYTESIIKCLLRLESGEALSVNTDEKDFELARNIAIAACEVTSVPVKIVITVNGKPSDVIDIDPQGVAVDSVRHVLLRLEHLENREMPEDALDIIVDETDFPTLQKLGHLAEPLTFGRRIALPWCVVPANPETEPAIDDDRIIAVDYRKKYLNGKKITSLRFKGEHTDFEVDVPPSVYFFGGTTVLSSGRTFVSTADYERLGVTLDCNSLEGKLRANAVIFGRKQTLNLEFKNGKLVSDGGSRELARLLEYDVNLRKAGWISMKDRDFRLYLGGSPMDGLDGFYEEEEELPAFFNTSLYSLELQLEDSLNVSCYDGSLARTELVRKGFFLE